MPTTAEEMERELAGAFEVKDGRCLHRFIYLVNDKMVMKTEHNSQYSALRSDIADLDKKIRENTAAINNLNAKVDLGFQYVNQRIDGLEQTMNQRVDNVEQALNKRMDSLEQAFDQRIGAVLQSTNTQFESVNRRFDALQEMMALSNKRFNVFFTLISTFLVAAGTFIALIQFLG